MGYPGRWTGPPRGCPQSAIRNPQSRNWVRFARFAQQAPPARSPHAPACPSLALFHTICPRLFVGWASPPYAFQWANWLCLPKRGIEAMSHGWPQRALRRSTQPRPLGHAVTNWLRFAQIINHKSPITRVRLGAECPSTLAPCCTNRAGILCVHEAPKARNSLRPKE